MRDRQTQVYGISIDRREPIRLTFDGEHIVLFEGSGGAEHLASVDSAIFRIDVDDPLNGNFNIKNNRRNFNFLLLIN